jgi:hypothetical protein
MRRGMTHADELPFTVELWDDVEGAPERTLARCARVDIAIGAYEKIVDAFPRRIVLLREGKKVVLSHRVRRNRE